MSRLEEKQLNQFRESSISLLFIFAEEGKNAELLLFDERFHFGAELEAKSF